MQKFRFRLEALLKYRRQLTDQAQAELGKAIVHWQRELDRLENLQSILSQNEAYVRGLQQNSVTIDELIQCHTYGKRLEQLILAQEEQVRLAAINMESCREKLAESMKQQKLVEKIKEKRLLKYQEELLAQEQKDLDEIGLQLFVREK